jgi:hemerythrin-like domain-containing protein
MSSPHLMRALRQDHRNLVMLLDLLEREIERFERAEGADYELMGAIATYCLDYPDKMHHPREDRLLERLRMRDPEAAAKIGDLEAEHRSLAALTRRFAEAIDDVLLDREIARETVDRVAREFLTAYRKHMAMEDETFFPVAEAALRGADWAALAGTMADPDDPLFGVRVARRFQSLRDDILAMAEAED